MENNIKVEPQETIETRVCKCCGKELPITMFAKKGTGIRSICRKCEEEKRTENRGEKFKDVTNRELIEELKRRGYKGELRLEIVTKETL